MGEEVNLTAFARDVLELTGDICEIDTCDIQDLAIKHGLLYGRPLTNEEVGLDRFQDSDLTAGDIIALPTEAFQALIDGAENSK